MVVTIEELQRMENMDIRELKREELDNAGIWFLTGLNLPIENGSNEWLEAVDDKIYSELH